MPLSAGKKAFLTFDVSCSGNGRNYTLIQLDRNPANLKYGWLVLENDSDVRAVDVFKGTRAHVKKLCGEKSAGMIIGNTSLTYSDELASVVAGSGRLPVPLGGQITYDTVSLSGLWKRGVIENELQDFGFEVGSDGLIDTSDITLSYTRSSLAEKFNNPLGWIGAGLCIAIAASGSVVLVGGMAVVGIVSAGMTSNEYSATWDRGASHYMRARYDAETGDRRGANLHLIEGAKLRGDVLGGSADFALKSGVTLGAGKLLTVRAAPTARAGRTDIAGRPIGFEGYRSFGGGNPVGPNSFTDGGLQAFGYIPGATKTVAGPGGLQRVVTTRQPVFMPTAQDILFSHPRTIVRSLLPDTSLRTSSPIPAVIVPPFHDPGQDGLTRYDMPGGRPRGPVFVPGADSAKEAIGDRPKKEKPIGDLPTRAERIGDPKTSHGPAFAPGVDNKTKFVAGDKEDDGKAGHKDSETKGPNWSDEEDVKRWFLANVVPGAGSAAPTPNEPDWSDPNSIDDWFEESLDRIYRIDDDVRMRTELAQFYGRVRAIPNAVIDILETFLFAEADNEFILGNAFESLISAGHPYAIERALEIAANEAATAIDGVPNVLEKLASSLLENRNGHPIEDEGARVVLAKRTLELLFARAEKGSASAAREFAWVLFDVAQKLSKMDEDDKKAAEQILKWATGKLLMAKIPLPDKPEAGFDSESMPVSHLASQAHLPSVRKLAQLVANGDEAMLAELVDSLPNPKVDEFLQASFGEIIRGHPQADEIQRELFRIMRALVRMRTIIAGRLDDASRTEDSNVMIIMETRANMRRLMMLTLYVKLYARFLIQTINASNETSESNKLFTLFKLRTMLAENEFDLINDVLKREKEEDAEARNAPARMAALITNREIRRVLDRLRSLVAERPEFEADFAARIDAVSRLDNLTAMLTELRKLEDEARARIRESEGERVREFESRRGAVSLERRGDRSARIAAYTAAQAVKEDVKEPAPAKATAEPAETRSAPRESNGAVPRREPTLLKKAISEPPENVTLEEIRVMTNGRVTFENGGWRKVEEFYNNSPAKRSSFFTALQYLLTGERANVKRMTVGKYKNQMRIRVGSDYRMIFEWRGGNVVIKAIGERGEIYERR